MSGNIEGLAELSRALDGLPGKVVKKIMDRWVLTQAQRVAAAAKAAAPRNRRRNRNAPESARLWRVIKASRVRRLGKFPGAISRALAFGSKATRGYAIRRQRAASKRNARRVARPVRFGPPTPRGGHFHLVNLGTRRRQTRSGANRGVMPANPFFARVGNPIKERARSEIGTTLRAAYDLEIQRELNRLVRRYT
jgi:hypothetical protein